MASNTPLPLKAGPNRKTASIPLNAFVISTPYGKLDADAKKVIRSHVRLGKKKRTKAESRARQRLEVGSWINSPDHATACLTPATTHSGGSERSDTRSSSNGTEGTSTRNKNVILLPEYTTPGNVGTSLALVRFASEMRHCDLELIHIFFTSMKRGMYPTDMCMTFDFTASPWFEYLSQDAAYVYSTLFCVSAYLDATRGNGSPSSHTLSRSSLFYLAKTLHLLRQSVESATDADRVSESTMCAVTALIMVTHCSGDNDGATSHLRGLHRMIQLHGGLGTLSKNSQLQIKACRADLGVAISTGRKPLFFSEGMSWRSYLAPYERKTPRTELHDVLGAPDWRLVNVWLDLKEFCRATNVAYLTGSKLDPILFHEVVTSVHYRLLQLEYEGGGCGAGGRGGLQEVLRLAMLGFATTVLLQVQGLAGFQQYENLATKLKAAVLDLSMPKDVAGREMMLWVVVVAGVSLCPPEGEGRWLRSCLDGMDCTSWKNWPTVRTVLKGRLWIDCLHDKPGENAHHSLFLSRTP